MPTREEKLKKIQEGLSSVSGSLSKLKEAKDQGLEVNPQTSVQDAESFLESKKTSLADVPLPDKSKDDPVERFANFRKALDTAVSLARRQRNDRNLDYLDGVIPPGSVRASSFTSLLADINQASDTFSGDIVKDTVDFAKEQQKTVETARANIQNLALDLVKQGASSQDIQTVLKFAEVGDVNGAITAASGLELKGNLKVDQIGSKLVTYDPKDPQGTLNVIFDGGTGGDDRADDFALAEEFVKENVDATDEELTAALLRDSELSVSEVNAIIAARKKTLGKGVAQKAAEAILDKFKDVFKKRATEKENAVESVKTLGSLKVSGSTIKLTESMKQEIIDAINAL